MSWGFEIGRVYSRQADIHAKYGGQEQGGAAAETTEIRPSPDRLFQQHRHLSDLTRGRTNVHTFVEYMVTDLLAQHFRSLIDYPPAQKGTTLSFDQMMEQLPKGKH
jgi:hypothetical protein